MDGVDMDILDKVRELTDKEYKFEVTYFRDYIILRSTEIDSDNNARSIMYYFSKDNKLLIKQVTEKGLRCIGRSLM